MRGDGKRLKRRNKLTGDSRRYLHVRLPDKDEEERLYKWRLLVLLAALDKWAATKKPEDFEVKDGDEPDFDVGSLAEISPT